MSRTELVAALARRVDREGLGAITSLLLSGDESPLAALSSALGTRATNVRELLQAEPPSRVVSLTLDGRDSASWSAFLLDAAKQSQIEVRPSFQLCVLGTPSFSNIRDDLFLAVHRWWGRITQLDIEWIVQDRLEANPPESLAARYWIRALCRGLAISDPGLAALLVEQCPKDVEAVRGLLDGADYVSELLVRAPLDGQSSRFSPVRAPNCDPQKVLWCEGLLDWQEGHGIVVKSRALKPLHYRQELERRLWRGQLEVFLPLVELVRRDVCRALSCHFGGGWAIDLCRRAVGKGVDVDDVESEIGELAKLFGSLPRHLIPRPVRRAVLRWRQLRNELAHAEAVDYALLEDCVESYLELLENEAGSPRGLR